MGFFSLFKKTVAKEEFDFEREHIRKDIQELIATITNEQNFVDQNFKLVESKLNDFQTAYSDIQQELNDLKIFGKLALHTQEQVETVLKRVETLETQVIQLNNTLLNFTKPSQQGLVNLSKPENRFTKRLVNVDQRFTMSTDSDSSQPGAGLLNLNMLTNTEKTLLLALYDLQADLDERAVAIKELMEKVYGSNASHSKLVYVSKMIKDLEMKGALSRIVKGNHSKVFLTREAVAVCEETIRARK